MVAPLPDEAPVTPFCTTVQENVVPVKLLVRAIEVAPPEVIACDAGVAVATGIGSSSSSHELINRIRAKRLKIKLMFFIVLFLVIQHNFYQV
jgi:hypothetical protein